MKSIINYGYIDVFLSVCSFQGAIVGSKDFMDPVGLSGLEPQTSRLSGVRSNRLSYKPS